MAETDLSHKQISELLNYDPHTGNLTWKLTRAPIQAGSLAGYPNERGYWRTGIFRHLLSNHRIAWLLHYGEWPASRLDHIDGNPSNNRIDNLRLATHGENMRNRKVAKNNKSGITGVCETKNKTWAAWIAYQGKTIHLGKHKTEAEAIKARKAAEIKYFKEFIRESNPQAPTESPYGHQHATVSTSLNRAGAFFLPHKQTNEDNTN